MKKVFVCFGEYPNSTRMEMIRVGAPPPREPAELPRTMATVGGGGAPPGELGNHSHREGGCAHPRGRQEPTAGPLETKDKRPARLPPKQAYIWIQHPPV